MTPRCDHEQEVNYHGKFSVCTLTFNGSDVSSISELLISRAFVAGMLLTLSVTALVLCAWPASLAHGCQLPTEWRPLSDGCRAELAEIIIYAKVLAIHREQYHGGAGSLYNSLPYPYGYGYEGAEEGLLYSAEVELLCDQAWGSMLEVPAGSRLNLTGLGYLSCQSHTVMENYSYIFFLR